MKLYNSVGPNPRLVRMFAAEKGIELELVPVDLMGGENRQADYLAKNYVGQLPCLELDDGTHIAETVVICEYLEDIHPAPALIGANAQEKAEARMWTRRVGQQIIDPLTDGFRFAEGLAMFKDRMRTIPQAADDLKANARDGMQALDGQIAGRDFIAGDRFTLADVCLFAFLEFGNQVGQGLDPSLPNLNAWYERVNARPSVEASR
jgi:glutathione S-transferase